MIKAVLFDLDGTLANTLDDIADSGNWALTQCGFAPYPVERYVYFVGSGVNTLIERMLADYPHTEQQYRQVLSLYSDRYQAHSFDKTRPYDGIDDLLEDLRRRQIACAVVSNKPMAGTRQVIETLFRPGSFAYIYGHMPPYAPKPAPEAVFHVLEQLGVQPADCLYIGDTDVDMQTARNAGIVSVGAVWGFRTRAELEANGAEYLADAPREVIDLVRRLNG